MEASQPDCESAMLQPSSVESLDIAQTDRQAAAANVATSLKEHSCTVLKLDEQSVFQMDTAQTALRELYDASDGSHAAQLGVAFKLSSGFVHRPEHEAAATESTVSLLSKVGVFKGLHIVGKPIQAASYCSAGLQVSKQNSNGCSQNLDNTTGTGCWTRRI